MINILNFIRFKISNQYTFIEEMNIKIMDITCWDDVSFKVTNVYGGILEISNGKVTKQVQRQELQKLRGSKDFYLHVPIYKCIRKLRDKNGKILGYVLVESSSKKQKQVSAERLKAAIYNYQAEVINLTLTKDNRLVDTTGDIFYRNLFRSRYKHIELTRYRVEQIMNLLVHAQKSLRRPKMELEIRGTYKESDRGKWKNIGNTGLVAQIKSIGNSIVMIVRPLEGCKLFLPENSDLLFVNRHTISYDSNERFLKFVELRLLGVDWSKVTSARKMFCCTKIQSLVIEQYTAHNFKNAEQFLQLSEVSKVDFDDFTLDNLENTNKMFSGCVNLSYDNMKLGDMCLDCADNIHQMFGIPYVADKTGKRFEATSEFIDCAEGLKGILNGKSDVRLKLYPDDSIDTENLSKLEELCVSLGREKYAENLKEYLLAEKIEKLKAEADRRLQAYDPDVDIIYDEERFQKDCDIYYGNAYPEEYDYEVEELMDKYADKIQHDAICIESDTCVRIKDLARSKPSNV